MGFDASGLLSFAACVEKLRVIPGFGKQNLTVGSLPGLDIVLAGDGVMPEHAPDDPPRRRQARLRLRPGDRLRQRPALNPGEQAPFDLRTQFTLGAAQVPIPLHHPAITLSLMTTGLLAAPPGQIVLGRDPSARRSSSSTLASPASTRP